MFMVAKGSTNTSAWRDWAIGLALSAPTHIKNTFFSYLPLVRVVCVVDIHLGFTDQLFCNLIMLIKWCKIQYLNLDKGLVF